MKYPCPCPCPCCSYSCTCSCLCSASHDDTLHIHLARGANLLIACYAKRRQGAALSHVLNDVFRHLRVVHVHCKSSTGMSAQRMSEQETREECTEPPAPSDRMRLAVWSGRPAAGRRTQAHCKRSSATPCLSLLHPHRLEKGKGLAHLTNATVV